MPGQQPFNYMNPGGAPPTGLVPHHHGGLSSGAPAAVKQVKITCSLKSYQYLRLRCFLLQGTPTVVAVQSDPSTDAAALRKAMKGFGTDEDGLINVLCRRTNAQRQAIAKCFKTSYGKDLIDDVKSETSGNFEKLLVALLTPLDVFYAKELYDAISGVGTDEDVLIETMCTLSNREINDLKNAFTRSTCLDDIVQSFGSLIAVFIFSLRPKSRKLSHERHFRQFQAIDGITLQRKSR
jgi:Annexin